MRHALDLAARAAATEEVPVAAVIVRAGLLVTGHANAMRSLGDPTAHAELLALREAGRLLGVPRLDGCTLYVTLEPCAMCAGAIVLARVSRVVFGAWDDKAGMGGSVGDILRHPRLNHQPEVLAGLLALESARLLEGFFAGRRARL